MLMLTKHAAQHTSAQRDQQCSSVSVTWTSWPYKIEQLDVLVMSGANAYAPDSYGLPHYIQVPEQHWADSWHYKETGFDMFADAFALGLVNHLRERGMVVEGSGLRSRT